jgi:hypothetical protein
MRKVLLLLMAVFTAFISFSQISVTATAGTAGPTPYATLSAAFTAINAGTHQGAITVSVTANSTETGACVLNGSGAGSASYTSVLIQPSVDGVTISGPTVTGRGLMELNGADNVTIDGDNPNSGGTNRDLTITNTAANTVGYTMVIRIAAYSSIITSADNNTVKNCILNGSGTGLNASGTTSTTGPGVTTYAIYAGPTGTSAPASATTAPSAIASLTSTLPTGGTINTLLISNNQINACAKGFVFMGAVVGNSTAVNVTNNTIGAAGAIATTFPASTPSTTVYTKGIFIQGVTSTTITGNTVQNILTYVITPVAAIELSSAIGSGTVNISNNTIAGVFVNTAGAAFTRGISVASAAGTYTISNNTVTNIQNSCNSTTATNRPIGIYVATAATSATIEKNRVSTVYDRNAGTYGVTALWLNGGNNILIKNNFIWDINEDITGGAAFSTQYGVNGISISSGTGHKVYHNTISLSGALFGTAATNILTTAIALNSTASTGMDVRNNIFSNTMSGGSTSIAHVAIYLPVSATSSMNLTLNNNAYYTGNTAGVHGVAHVGTTYSATAAGSATYAGLYPTAGFNASNTTPASGAAANFRAYSSILNAAGTNDNSSFASNAAAPFASTTDLHIVSASPSQLESGGIGTATTGITTDIDEDVRPGPVGSVNGGGVAPDMGADEFDGAPLDLTAPSISFTNLSNTSSTTNRTVTGFATITDGSGVNVNPGTSPRLYFKKSTDANDAGGWKYVEASNGASPFDFTIDYSMIGGANGGDVIQYFVVAQDNATTPNVGINSGIFNATPPSVDLAASSAFPIGGTIKSYTISTIYNGDIFVGSSQTITSLTNTGGLFDILNNNIVGSNLTVHITSDLLAETGTVALNQALEDGVGNYTIKIMPDAPYTISGTSTSALIKLNGADRITIDGSTSGGTDKSLTITNTSTGTSSGIIWAASASASNAALDVTVKNCIISGNASTTTLVAVGAGGLTVGSVALANNNNFVVQNNTIFKAQYAIYAGGVSTSSLSTGVIIADNTIGTGTAGEGFLIGGIKISLQDGALISKNDVQNIKGAGTVNMEGISLVDTKNITVSANKVHGMAYSGASTYKVYGITTSTTTFGVVGNQSVNSFVNNMVYDLVSSGTSASWNTSGINNNGGYNDKYYFNSVYLTGSLSGSGGTAGSACFSNGNGITTTNCPVIDMRNNIFYMKGTSVAAAPLYAHYTTVTTYTGSTLNNNDLLSAATAPATSQLGYLSSNRTNLSAWQTATSQETNSFSVDPLFTSATDLHINAGMTTSVLESTGANIGGITVDIDGDQRPGPAGSANGGGTVSDIGADEFDGVPLVLCATPSAQPSAMILNPSGNSVITGSFTAAVPAASGYLIVRTTSSTLAATPVDATTYSVGANTYFGTGGYVESTGTGTTINSTGLTGGTTYYYWVFSFTTGACTGGPKYLTASPLSGNATTGALFTSIATGNWEDGSTWNQSGAVPSATSDVIVAAGHTVTVNAATSTAASVTVNATGILNVSGNTLSVLTTVANSGTITASGGTLNVTGATATGINTATGGVFTVSGGTVNVGVTDNTFANRTFANSGTLTVSSGTLNVYGNFNMVSGCTFTQSGGSINVDGNAGGNAANSVASGTALVNFGSSTITSTTLSGGTFTIVDPHANSTLNLSLNVSSGVIEGIVASTAHTFRFGNGSSTDAGGNAVGFRYYSWASTGFMKFGNLIVTGPAGTNRAFTAAGASDTYYNLVVKGDLTINNGGEYKNLGAAVTNATYLGGNLTVNTGGTFTSANNVYFGDATALTSTTIGTSAVTNAQTISGSGTFKNLDASPTAKFASITVNNTNSTGVTFASSVSPVTVTGALTVTTGNVAFDALTLNGTTAQTVPLTAATSIITVKDFVLNNTAGATLSGSGKLNISNTATISAGTLAAGTGGRLVLKSSALGTARIPAIVGAITGTVTAETYIPGGRRAFRFLGHPFSTALDMTSLKDNIFVTGAGAGFDATTTNNPSAYWYDNVGSTWTAFTSSADASWTQYRGIRALVRGDRTQTGTLTGSTELPNAVTLDVTGTLNTGAANISVPTAGAYHLISNPYPSPVDIGTVMNAAVPNIGPLYWIWDANAVTRGAYVIKIVDGLPYSLAMNGAFVVQPTSGTTLAFTEANKTASPTANLFRTNGTGKLLELEVQYNNYYADNLFVNLDKDSKAAMDVKDGQKLVNQDVNLYSLSGDNKKLSLDARPMVDGSIIPLGFTTTIPSTYKFKVANYGFSNDVTMYLKDRYTNTLTPVDANMEYEFAVTSDAASQGESRFELVMKQVPLLALTTSFDVTITPNPVSEQMTINYSSPEKGQAVVRIFNAAGKAVQTANLGTVDQMGRATINVKGLAAGVYSVEMTIGKERATKQVVKL